ncbi:hypothetical protein [Holdemanella biformis]|uniref:hypothetical protein n=1 Tax=Holdemanella biformis TaxID=1735 RepID=UPI003AB4DA3E
MKVKEKGQNIELNKRNETIEDNPKMKTFDDMLVKQLQNDEFKKEYEAIQPEMDVIRARVDARTSQEQ